MNVVLWTLAAYLCGSLPFSVWLGRLVLGTEIRQFGDGNPGGTNVIRAGSRPLGLAVILLDGLKGLLPVLAAQEFGGLQSWALASVALAAVTGHAFSIFLRFQGGKAVAVTFGIWTGLTGWSTLFVLGALLLFAYYLIKVDGWAVVCALFGLLVFIAVTGSTGPHLYVWFGNGLIVAWKHHLDLAQRPGLRPPFLP
ncbi:MAG: glycerol-3-phosphate acyltransferase [Caldilineaceae bacterium]|nr:glycerol-3-phosphate acyltransferase [Caldilineaceae bacterium]